MTAACLLWSSALQKSDFAQDYYETVSLRFENNHLKQDQIKEIIENEDKNYSTDNLAITAWGKERNASVEDKYRDRKSKVDLLYIYGKLPAGLDMAKGCALSYDAAYSLWGGGLTGGEVAINGRNYPVNRIINSLEATAIIYGEDDVEYEGIELTIPAGKADSGGIDSFIARNGLSPTAVIRYNDAAKAMGAVASFPGIIAGLLTLASALHNARRRKGNLAEKAVLWIVFATVCILWAAIELPKISIPQDFIPTRWSAFEFWQAKSDGIREGITQYFLTPHTRGDLLFASLFTGTAAMAAVSSVLTAASFIVMRLHPVQKPAIAFICTLVIPFAVFLIMGGWSMWYQAVWALYVLTESVAFKE